MASVEIISVVPVELFTEQNIEIAKSNIANLNAKLTGKWVDSASTANRGYYRGLARRIASYVGSSKVSIYEFQYPGYTTTGTPKPFAAFVGTSAVFVYITKENIIDFSKGDFKHLVYQRRLQNKYLTSSNMGTGTRLRFFSESIRELVGPKKRSLVGPKKKGLTEQYLLGEHISPSYGFTFYSFELDQDLIFPIESFLKKLIEPDSHKIGYLLKLDDLETTETSHIYSNWSTICIANSRQQVFTAKTHDEVLALEIALQTSWNRCHSMSKLISAIVKDDSIIDKMLKEKHDKEKALKRMRRKEKSKECKRAISEAIKELTNGETLYNSFLNATNEANSLLSPTTSERIVTIYDKMIETSRINIQSNRLENRLTMLSHHYKLRETTLAENTRRFTGLSTIVILTLTLMSLLFIFISLLFTNESYLESTSEGPTRLVIIALYVLFIHAVVLVSLNIIHLIKVLRRSNRITNFLNA